MNTILSTEIKKGQVIKLGNFWGISLEDSQPSNVKNQVKVSVKVLDNTIKRNGRKQFYKGGYREEWFFRNTTKVKTK